MCFVKKVLLTYKQKGLIMKKETIGDVPGNVLGMMADLCLKIRQGVIKPEEFGLFLKRKDPFSGEAEIMIWKTFWKKYFSISTDLSQIQILSYQEGFDRVIIVPKGITEDRVFQVCSEKFKIRKRTNQELSEVIDHNDRMSTETYAIRVRDCQEADKENKNISAEQAKEKDINGITLLERLIYELKYWDETEKHLDMANLTICSDSRCSDGYVPGVYCGDDGVGVDWCNPRRVYSNWRVRTVVSC